MCKSGVTVVIRLGLIDPGSKETHGDTTPCPALECQPGRSHPSPAVIRRVISASSTSVTGGRRVAQSEMGRVAGVFLLPAIVVLSTDVTAIEVPAHGTTALACQRRKPCWPPGCQGYRTRRCTGRSPRPAAGRLRRAGPAAATDDSDAALPAAPTTWPGDSGLPPGTCAVSQD